MADNRSFYNEIIIEHNTRPYHKHPLPGANLELRGYNPSCGDDIVLRLQVEEGRIVDGAFTGSGCAISQASADMMLDLVLGRPAEEALELAQLFLRMIKGQISPEEKERLEEAAALEDVAHMPARVKCAVLGWRTLEQMLGKEE